MSNPVLHDDEKLDPDAPILFVNEIGGGLIGTYPATADGHPPIILGFGGLRLSINDWAYAERVEAAEAAETDVLLLTIGKAAELVASIVAGVEQLSCDTGNSGIVGYFTMRYEILMRESRVAHVAAHQFQHAAFGEEATCGHHDAPSTADPAPAEGRPDEPVPDVPGDSPDAGA